ncbi:MAG: hypothetical protein KF819_27470 [Labilithrix sp.]|nr:hypothetical protein [Labilithrix sp.]
MGRTLTAGAAVSLVAVVALAEGCTFIQPETGDRISACVDGDSDPANAIEFKTRIRPLMNGEKPGTKGCAACHYSTSPNQAGQEGLIATQLDLSSLRTLRNGGVNTRGTIVVPGKPCSSAIVQKLRGTANGARMPKNGPYWSPEDIQLVADWIAEGANGGDDE